MLEDIIETKSGITISVDVNVKSYWYNIYVKKIVYDILVDLLGNLILTCENKTLNNKTTVNTSPYNTGSFYCYYLLLFLIFASSHN